jgi:hypothetical protein
MGSGPGPLDLRLRLTREVRRRESVLPGARTEGAAGKRRVSMADGPAPPQKWPPAGSARLIAAGFRRVGKLALIKHQRNTHAHQFERAIRRVICANCETGLGSRVRFQRRDAAPARLGSDAYDDRSMRTRACASWALR